MVTRGAQPVGKEPGCPAVAQAPLWGLGRVMSLEVPELWGGLVDLAPGSSAEAAIELLGCIDAPDGEDQVAIRDGQRYVPRLVALPSPGVTGEMSLSPDASYLITGGLGRLGLRLARWRLRTFAHYGLRESLQ